MRWEIFLFAGAAIVFIAVKGIFDYIFEKRRMLYRLGNEWGKMPDREYIPGKIDSVKLFYEHDADSGDVDDITWNDLDMDEMYMMLNNTGSSMGEEVLYRLLRKPLHDGKEIDRRKNIIKHMYENRDDRIKLQRKLAGIGYDGRFSFYEFFMRIEEIKKENNAFHYALVLLMAAGIAGIFADYMFCVAVLVGAVCVSIITYYKRKAEIEAYYYIFGCILKMLYSSAGIARLDIPAVKGELEDIGALTREFDKFRRGSGIVLKPKGGNISDIVFDYVRMLTHIDLIKFNRMYGYVTDNKNKLLELHGKIGFLDSMVAVASFREMLNDRGWCEPEFESAGKRLSFENGYHPFLKEPVYNSFDTESSVLLTGSNASGKSTFLKMIAVNAILSQTVVTVAAESYRAPYFKIMTSMALSDNIFSNKSYFIVEIMSLKRILDSCGGETVLCCIDEVLRGTNTVERIAASGQILKCLAGDGVLCFAATHDIELAGILDKYYANYHFQEKIENDNVLFDYVIYEGPSRTKNAIRLLDMLGYDGRIVREAEVMAEKFEKDGYWKRV